MLRKIDNTSETDQLSPRQRLMIPLLLVDRVEAACIEGKTNRQTVYRWLKQEAFKQAVEEAGNEVFDGAMQQVKTNCQKVVSNLIELLEAERQDVHCGAAALIVEHALRLTQLERSSSGFRLRKRCSHG